MFKGITTVIFDLDGTLVDSMGMWAEIDTEFLGKRQIPVPENVQKTIEGKSFTETAEYFKRTFNLEESVEEITAEWVEMSKEYYRNRVPMKDGAVELVKYLHLQGFKIGLATSSQHDLVDVVLQSHNLKTYFDSIRTSCDVGKGKPFPDVFLKVAEDLEVEPAECLVFEDTFAGVLAAKRSGMKVVAVYDNFSRPYMKEISDLADGYIVNFKGIA